MGKISWFIRDSIILFSAFWLMFFAGIVWFIGRKLNKHWDEA
jgi:hypothetical protein